MTAPTKHGVILNPPHPGIHKDSKESYKYLYELWKRTGGYTSQILSTENLQASVLELNTLVGINTSEKVQAQLDSKANKADLGTMSTQDADSVAITGGAIEVTAGTSSDKAKVGGTLYVDLIDHSNSGAAESTLATYTLKANSLHANNDYLEIHGWGTYAANINSKRIKLKIGIAAVYETGLLNANDGTWSIKAKMLRKDNVNGKAISEMLSSNTSVPDESKAVNFISDFGSAQIIQFTGEGAVSDDIVQRGFLIKWAPN